MTLPVGSQYNPAHGRDALIAFGMEKGTLGIRQGPLRFLKPDSTDSRVDYGWNKASTVIAGVGEPAGTPGGIKLPGKPIMDLTTWNFAMLANSMFGAPASLDAVTAATSWRAVWYPRKLTAAQVRAITEYVYYGADAVGAIMVGGRQAGKISLGEKADNRIKLSADWQNAGMGANHIGFVVAKTGNSGTFAGQFSLKGVRQQDSDYTAGKSLYLKVHSIVGSVVNFYSKIDTATDGSGDFSAATGSYGTAITAVKVADSSIDFDGFVQVLDATGANIGNFGEDYHPLLIGVDTVTGFAVGDEFEFPVEMEALTPTYVSQLRYSTFHVSCKLGDRIVRFDNATAELDYGVKPWNSQGRYPSYVDRVGSAMMTLKYSERSYDSFIRNLMETNSTTGMYLAAIDGALIPGSAENEGVEIWLPQARCTGAAEREVKNRDVLTSAPTFSAEDPEDNTNAGPQGYLPGTHSIEIACTFREDPTTFF